jgi:hypothetical protein
MLIGLTNASATFQALMNNVLWPFLRRFVLVFFDDIVIYNSSLSEHLHHVRLVLEQLQAHQLFVKRSKCLQRTLRWLLGPRHLRGRCPHGRQQSPRHHCLTRTTDRARGPRVPWASRVLPAVHPRLRQHRHATHRPAEGHVPIAPRHAKLAAYERELIGLVQAVRHWCPYLWGLPFIIRTNHYSLKFLLVQRLSMIPQHQWASKLLDFNFSVEYTPVATNVVANALSHCHEKETGELVAISAPTFEIINDLHREIDSDLELRKLKQDVVAGDHGGDWALVDGPIIVSERVFVPRTSASLSAQLTNAHDTGHEGIQKTLHRLRDDFQVPGARLCSGLHRVPVE